MNGVGAPHFLLIDVDEPVKNVVDTGGVPIPDEMRVVLGGGYGMDGEWEIRQIHVELVFTAGGMAPRVRLYLKRREEA